MDFYVGIDVSKYKHTVSIIDQEGVVRKKSFDFSNSREGFDFFLNELGLLGLKEQIKIGMEATGHYMNCLVRCLVSNGYQVQIYNPSIIAKFRDSEAVNSAKTDNLDALLIAKYVSTHAFTSSPQLSYLIGEIRKISRAKYFLFGDKTCCYNHLLRYLDEIFPEFVPFYKKKEDGNKRNAGRNMFESPTVRWLLTNYPSASKMAKMRVETAEALRRMSKGKFSYGRFVKLKELASNTVGLDNDIYTFQLDSILSLIETMDKQISLIEDKISKIIDLLNPRCLSIKGIGNILCASIVAEFGDFSRFKSADACLAFAGLEPSTI